MKGKILIVEDEFIVAGDLRMILEKAGHQVCGIAPSATKALEIIELDKPGCVFLELQLTGKLNGIDLAFKLNEAEIPFIYISAEFNLGILEKIRKTKPYGFLIKPFLEKDALTALNIAIYRHENILELKLIKEYDLQSAVLELLNNSYWLEKKLAAIFKLLNNHIHFDYGSVCWESADQSIMENFAFLKKPEGNFAFFPLEAIARESGKSLEDLKNAKKVAVNITRPTLFCNSQFEEMIAVSPFRKLVSKAFDLSSVLLVPINVAFKGTMVFSFYSRMRTEYDQKHLELIDRLMLLFIKIADHFLQAVPDVNITVRKVNQNPNAKPLFSSHLPPRDENDHELVGLSVAFEEVKKKLELVSPFDISVLIMGESGTGKESIVRSIHQLSVRRNRPLIKVNCPALPAILLESELFGHEDGAFSGAAGVRIGKFEQAQGGTIFLDEIGEFPLNLQDKLLAVLQEKQIVRLGGNHIIKTDVRIISATNKNLEKEVAEGRFRLDLYYRLNVFPITLPPLRERKEDIPELAYYFLKKLSRKFGKKVNRISDEVIAVLIRYNWPGNIRELANLIERGVLLTSGNILTEIGLPEKVGMKAGAYMTEEFKTASEVEKEHIMATLKRCNGRISGPGGAAELLDLSPATLMSKINKLGITRKFTG
jgi:DNA-binding NtrC family response regulator